MDDLQIKETQKTPRIIFRKTGEFRISGNSFLENAEEFYEPIIQWLENYTLSPAEKTIMHFEFNYYNTTSQLWIYRILENLADLKKIGKDVEINWYYEEEEIQEAGIDLANLLNLEVNFIYKETDNK